MLATALAVATLLVGLAVAIASPGTLVDWLFAILLVGAVLAELVAPKVTARFVVSGGFVAGMLAAAFLGPAAAFIVPAAGMLGPWVVERYRWRALLINLAGAATPTALAALVLQQPDLADRDVLFVVTLALLTGLTLAANVLFTPTLFRILDGGREGGALRTLLGLAPTWAINAALIATIAELYAQGGFLILLFAVLNVVAFTYMARLVVTAQERTREYASLSWGVLSSLVRTLDERDSRAARHCAAVAAFSRDIAAQAGMSKRDQELAHTAGLLHDIGKFALSDRVMERGGAPGGRRLARHPPPSGDRRLAAHRHRRVRARGRDRARPPRAPRRPRIPARRHRRGDPADRQDRRGGRGLRHADRARHVPDADDLVRGAARTAARRRHPARRHATSRRSPRCSRAAARSTATPTRPTSTASSIWSAGCARRSRRSSNARRSAAARRALAPRLQRREEGVELLARVPPLAAGRPAAGQVPGVRPAPDGRDRDPEVLRRLRDGQPQGRGREGRLVGHGAPANGTTPGRGERDDGFAQVRWAKGGCARSAFRPARRRAPSGARRTGRRWSAGGRP